MATFKSGVAFAPTRPSLFNRAPITTFTVPSWEDAKRGGASGMDAEMHDTYGRFERKKPSGKSSKYVGVHRTYPSGKWEAQTRMRHRAISLGCFATEFEAAVAYDIVAVWKLKHVGKWAQRLNLDMGRYKDKIDDIQNKTLDELVAMLRKAAKVRV